MPRLTTAYPKGHKPTGPRETVLWECPDEWMERREEDGENKAGGGGELSSVYKSNHLSAVGLPQCIRTWTQALRESRCFRGWYNLAFVGVVWSVCQVEAPLHPSLQLKEVCWRLLLACMPCTVLGCCVLALRSCVKRRQRTAVSAQRRQEVMAERTVNQYSELPRNGTPGHQCTLAHVLADSVLLCVLQEALSDPGLPLIKALLMRLEMVSHTLEQSDVLLSVTLSAQWECDSILMEKVKLLTTYLQQRIKSLRRLVQVQGELEASVKDMMEGLEHLWTQLEYLHTGVTLTKDWSQGQGDLSTAKTEAENLSTVLAQYKSRLEGCQSHHRDSTQLLQELTWSHRNISQSVCGHRESVWPELLLQANIEKFDKVQESFHSLEQQTSTFKAHLQGLGVGLQNDKAKAPPLSNRVPCTCSVNHNSPSCCCSGDITTVAPCDPSPTATPDPSVEEDTPPTLCERSAFQFSNAFGRLRRSGRRK